MTSIDTYREAFLKFLGEGMTHLEAYEQFDEKLWQKAMVDEIMEDGWMARRWKHSLLNLSVEAGCERYNQEQAELAAELCMAGWTSEPPPQAIYYNMGSLYWRRPSRRPGRPGRLFKSTQQALNALRKEKQ